MAEVRESGDRPGSISVAGYDFLDRSVEVARLWVENHGPATCVIQPERLAEPEMFGMLMVDAIRHAARAYSQCYGLTEGDALERIWKGLDDERAEHTTPLGELQAYGKKN